MKVTVTLVVNVDQEGWREEYGTEEDVRADDVTLHVLDCVMKSYLSELGILSGVRLT